ncbi:MAG: type transport system permease protein [Acidobacteriota bacterium]|jgi:ABC-2 type transport system permease protein|nr:type transport system permease protein [Acidobacteriota bacterium]
MNKMFAVLKREYLTTVRKKMFVFMTIFVPVLMAALFLLPGLMVARGIGTKRVAVIDGTGELRSAFTRVNDQAKPDPKKPLARRRGAELPQTIDVDYIDARGHANLKETSQPYLHRISSDDKATKLDAVLVIPPDAFEGPEAKMTFYSRASTDFFTQERLARVANKSIQLRRLSKRGIDADAVDALTREVPIDGVQVSKSGEEKKGGEGNFIIGFLFAALLILPSFVHGVEIMRGIIQEKTDRVVEILISSMSPTELLTGKVTGIALVGLTQISAWLLMTTILGSFGAATAMLAGFNLMQFLRPMVFVYFFVFFLLAYFTYVCVYAIAGAVCNTDKEAQQMIAPVSIIMMLPWFMMLAIITNPDSNLAVIFSMMPVFGPITMFVRTLVSDPPVWHILVSIAVSLVTIALFFKATAKIFRVGILSYGKRPTVPELWRWLKVA